jgi:hypothetical protein
MAYTAPSNADPTTALLQGSGTPSDDTQWPDLNAFHGEEMSAGQTLILLEQHSRPGLGATSGESMV